MNRFAVIAALFCLNALGATSLEELLRGTFASDLPSQSVIEIRRTGGPAEVAPGTRVLWFRPRPPVGSVGYELGWETEGTPQRWRGTADVSVRVPVVVSVRDLRHGQKLTSDAMVTELREIQPHLATGYFTDPGRLVGQEVRGWVRKGRVLGTADVAPPTLVHSGQDVDLVHRSGALTVSARVRALQNGRQDEWIRVVNPRSRKSMRVRVAGLGRVSLN